MNKNTQNLKSPLNDVDNFRRNTKTRTHSRSLCLNSWTTTARWYTSRSSKDAFTTTQAMMAREKTNFSSWRVTFVIRPAASANFASSFQSSWLASSSWTISWSIVTRESSSQLQTLHNWVNFATFCCSAFYNWWRQRKHKRETKDETHLHMVSYSTTLANYSSFK